MWRTSWRHILSAGFRLSEPTSHNPNAFVTSYDLFRITRVSGMCSSTTSNQEISIGVGNVGNVGYGVVEDSISVAEAKKLMRLVNVEALKMKLGFEGKEMIGYSELLAACQRLGVARSSDEAATFAKVLDEAGVVLLFGDQVYLHPDKVVDLVRKAMPLALTSEDDPRREELKHLQETKEQIDSLAKKQVSRILWSGLGISVFQLGLFFRLTFWEFSWDVMEPIAFFTTTSGIVVGYAYFLFTSRDPSYQDMKTRLFLARRRKLYKKMDFDVCRYMELRKRCKSPLELSSSRGLMGMKLVHDEGLHGDLTL